MKIGSNSVNQIIKYILRRLFNSIFFSKFRESVLHLNKKKKREKKTTKNFNPNVQHRIQKLERDYNKNNNKGINKKTLLVKFNKTCLPIHIHVTTDAHEGEGILIF